MYISIIDTKCFNALTGIQATVKVQDILIRIINSQDNFIPKSITM
jgi:hypothetical protein